MAYTDDGKKSNAQITKPRTRRVRPIIWAIGKIKRQLHKRAAKKKEGNPADQAAKRTATATVWIAIFTIVLALVGGITLFEVIIGGNDTHDLAVAAKKQAAANVQQVSNFAALAIAAKNQADAASKLAMAAQKQIAVMGDQLKVSRDTFEAANRPYLGTKAKAMYGIINGNQTKFPFEGPTEQTDSMEVIAEIKNYGTVPANKSKTEWEVLINGKNFNRHTKIPDTPSTIYPGGSVYKIAELHGPAYVGVVRNGSTILVLQVTVEYDGPQRHYKECVKSQFAYELAEFVVLGECTITPPPPN